MKKFIFRNPFVTKQDRLMAEQYFLTAKNNLDTANRWCKRDDGTYTDAGSKLIIQATEMRNLAAKRLGFRNAADMEEYKNRHVHL